MEKRIQKSCQREKNEPGTKGTDVAEQHLTFEKL